MRTLILALALAARLHAADPAADLGLERFTLMGDHVVVGSYDELTHVLAIRTADGVCRATVPTARILARSPMTDEQARQELGEAQLRIVAAEKAWEAAEPQRAERRAAQAKAREAAAHEARQRAESEARLAAIAQQRHVDAMRAAAELALAQARERERREQREREIAAAARREDEERLLRIREFELLQRLEDRRREEDRRRDDERRHPGRSDHVERVPAE